VEKNESVYAKWTMKFPVNMVEENKLNLQSCAVCLSITGKTKSLRTYASAVVSSRLPLATTGIPHIFEIYAGGDHGNKIRQRPDSRVVQFFSEKLDFAEK